MSPSVSNSSHCMSSSVPDPLPQRTSYPYVLECSRTTFKKNRTSDINPLWTGQSMQMPPIVPEHRRPWKSPSVPLGHGETLMSLLAFPRNTRSYWASGILWEFRGISIIEHLIKQLNWTHKFQFCRRQCYHLGLVDDSHVYLEVLYRLYHLSPHWDNIQLQNQYHRRLSWIASCK